MAPAGDDMKRDSGLDLGRQVLTGASFSPPPESPADPHMQQDSSPPVPSSTLYVRGKKKISVLLEEYKQFVSNNVETVTQLEYWMKTFSYLIAGRISTNHSSVIAELFYSSANLLIMYNDYILRHKLNLDDSAENPDVKRVKVILTVIECVEVLVEIAGARYLSNTAKWILIFAVQLIKTVGRFLLSWKYRAGLRCFPLIKRLDRKSLFAGKKEKPAPAAPDQYTVLKSGRRIKSMRGANLPSSESDQSTVLQADESSELSREQLLAESLHNLQPLIHLGTLFYCGEKSWAPWLTSLVVDVTSLTQLRREKFEYNRTEDIELTRRKFMLLLYMLRSPFYDRHSKVKILRFLAGVGARVPGAHYITDALAQYLPQWQDMYFYVWSS